MRKYEWLIGASIVVVCLFVIMILAAGQGGGSEYEGYSISTGGEKIALIKLLGPIYSSGNIVNQFKRFGKNDEIKAIVFRVDSPGGGVAASQEIYNAVRRVCDTGKPVVVSMGSVAASGGYYVSCGADSIVANPGTTTGSIGVIAEFVNLEGLFHKIGIEYETVKSGEFKDTGSPHRGILPAERRYLQGWINDAYEQFVSVVMKERGLSRKQVIALADGRVYTGKQAKELGLVDELGDLDDAIALAADMAKIKGEPAVIQLRRREISLFDLLLQQAEDVLRGSGGQALMYRYR